MGRVVNSTDLENTLAEIGRVGVFEISRVVNYTDLENTQAEIGRVGVFEIDIVSTIPIWKIGRVGFSEKGRVVNSTDLENTQADIGRVGATLPVLKIHRPISVELTDNSTDMDKIAL